MDSLLLNTTVGTQRYHAASLQVQEPRVKRYVVAEQNKLLKHAIWAYFLLLIFEGALRKWFLPGLATPLLIVRDPIAMWIILNAWHRGQIPVNPLLISTVFIGIIGIFTATLLGHGSLPVALFGARILLLHFPMMFVIGKIMNREDVIKIGKATLLIAIPMTILVALQFYSPQSAWVNRGVGGDAAGAGFSGALGYFRPPGTFSFTNGLSSFYSFVAPFVFYFLFDFKRINKAVLICALLALLASIPLSISRSLLFSIGVTGAFSLAAVSRRPKYLGRMIGAIIGIVLALTIVSQVSYIQTAMEAFTSRFESANENEGGIEGVLLDRYLGGLVGALTGNEQMPFWGYGLGMGTNVGSMLLSGGTAFLISEGEWGRLIGELGPFLGIAIIFIRLSFSFKVAVASYKKLMVGDLLPWLLLSYGLLIIPQGQWAQPTSLGFSTLIGGLILASFRANIKRI